MGGEGVKVYGSLLRLPLVTLGVWRLPFDESSIAHLCNCAQVRKEKF